MKRSAKWIMSGIFLTLLWAGLLLAGSYNGWFREPLAPPDDAKAFMSAAIEYTQESEPVNIAIVLIEGGKVFDSYYSENINQETLFPIASMSKWITTYGVMKLVEAGKINLDAPISTYLTRWYLPNSEFDNDLVTTRLLLSHTAGLTDDLGFGDYKSEEVLPTLEESLTHPRASSGQPVSIKLGQQPGSQWQYSGGGYLILELLIEEISQMSFSDYMKKEVFTPLGMKRSNYDYLGNQENIAQSQTEDGKVIPHYQYASLAATGLSTTASDLILFSQGQLQPKASNLLSTINIELMRKPHAFNFGIPIWGLGTMLHTDTKEGNFIFGHAGQNDPAINAEIRLNPDNGDGIIILETGNASLATRLGFLWTFWQTGLPDFIGFTFEVARTLPAFGIGVIVIFMSCFFGWRREHHRQ